MERPDYLAQGETARLFPVLANTSKEGRTTSIVLACIGKIDEFGRELLRSVNVKAGVRAKIETYTEVVFKSPGKTGENDRPDGLIVVKNGARQWRALVETKVGNSEIDPHQVERYRTIAKENGLDCVITISNQFATVPEHHPVEVIRKSRSKIPVLHWSWMFILTTGDLLLSRDDVVDSDQRLLLNELRRFLTHDSAGIRGFDRMPPEWSDLNKLISAGGRIPAKSEDAITVLDAWHQETKDLSLILSRQTETTVQQKLIRKYAKDPAERLKGEMQVLREHHQLRSVLDIPDAAAPLEVCADISRRTLEVGMTLRAPEDRVSSKARVNWLTKQIRAEAEDEIFVRLNWPGRSEPTQYALTELREDASISEQGKDGLRVLSFHVFAAKRLGAKFTQVTNFISELETMVPAFYREVGQNLVEWRKKAPRIKPDRREADDVDVEALAEDSEQLLNE